MWSALTKSGGRIERFRHAILAAVILIACATAATWALRAPIDAPADENTHADYVFAIWSNGGPIAASLHPLRIEVHPFTRFFEETGGFDETRFDRQGHPPPGYGTAAYFAEADRRAPLLPPDWWAHASGTPYIAASYPFGFYAIEAAVFGATHAATGSAIESFFAMRLFCVLLLALTLVAAYAALREMHARPPLALALTAAIGWLPTMDVVFSSVQPDALSIALFTISLWLALRARRTGVTFVTGAAIALDFGLFACTKVHIFAAVAIAVVPLLIVRLRRDRNSWPRTAAMMAGLLAPAAIGNHFASGLERHAPTDLAYSSYAGRFAQLRTDPVPIVREALSVASDTLRSAYGLGNSEFAYYHDYSLLHTSIFEGVAKQLLDTAIGTATFGVIALALVRVWTASRRTIAVGRRRGAGRALAIVASDPVWNAYVAYIGILVLAEIYVDAAIKLEGRYLLPAVLGAVSIAGLYAPRALDPARRRAVAASLAVSLAAYGAVGSAVGVRAMTSRYYDANDGSSARSELAIFLFRFGDATGTSPRVVPEGTIVPCSGYGFDSHRTVPAKIEVVLDGTREIPVRNGIPSRKAMLEMGDERLLKTGFEFDLDTTGLAPGDHALSFFAEEAGGRLPAERAPLHFQVVPGK